MTEYGPAGGDGGYPFDEAAPAGMEVGALIVTYGTSRSVVAGIQAIYRSPTGALHWGDMHGSLAANTKQFPIALDEGEFIVEISGSYGQFLDQLQVTTSMGKTWGPFPDHVASNLYEYPPTQQQPQEEVFGFHGRASQLVDSLGIHTRPR